VEEVANMIYGVRRSHAFSMVAVALVTISQVKPIPINATNLWI